MKDDYALAQVICERMRGTNARLTLIAVLLGVLMTLLIARDLYFMSQASAAGAAAAKFIQSIDAPAQRR